MDSLLLFALGYIGGFASCVVIGYFAMNRETYCGKNNESS